MTGAIVWFTGLPASGKSTLAQRVRDRLAEARRCAVVLDGDTMREVLGARSYEGGARDAYYRTLASLAGALARQGTIVLVPATAPRRAHRDLARATGCRVIEVWVATPLATCEARDRKGLYVAARTNPASTLPGVGAPYEPPEEPDVTARGGHDAAAADVIAALALH